MLSVKDIRFICDTLEDEIKNPGSELCYSSEYSFLVAVVLSAQTTDRQVNSVVKVLFEIVDSPEEMLDLGYDKLCGIIKPTGFYRSKAKHVIELSRQLIDNFDGKVPGNLSDLITLAGVGRKTANVVLNQIFNMPTIAVDTHVFRVSRRLGLSKMNDVDGVEKDLEAIIPDEYKQHIGNRILLHGRYVCTAKNPHCDQCRLSSVCEFRKNALEA